MDNIIIAVLTAILLYLLIGLQIASADRAGFLTLAQMRKQGITAGLPLMYHLGIWADTVALSPLLIALVAIGWKEWSPIMALVVFLAALVGSFLIHQFVYRKGGFEEAHVRRRKVTATGWYHCLYMSIASMILFLFYIYVGEKNPELLIATTIYLPIHFLFGTHMILAFSKPAWFPKRPVREWSSWLTVVLITLSSLIVCIGKLSHWF